MHLLEDTHTDFQQESFISKLTVRKERRVMADNLEKKNAHLPNGFWEKNKKTLFSDP